MTSEDRALPKYKSHKDVWALQISHVHSEGLLHFSDEDYAPLEVGEDYIKRHNPHVGGYYVVYKDGYESFSPAEAFEEGNTLYSEHMVDSASDERVVNNTMRHQYRVLELDEKANMAAVKTMGLDFHTFVDDLGGSRELSLAKTKIEEAVMWAVKHITG